MFLEGFESYLKYEKRYSPNTLISYMNDVKQFASFLSEQYNLTLESPDHIQSLTSKHIRSWIVELVEKDTLPSSIKRKLSALKTYFKTLQLKNVLKTNPADKISTPKIPERLPKFVPEKGINNMLENTHGEFSDDYSGNLDRLIIEMLYNTGLRRQELINIKIADINFVKRELKVLGKGNKERILPLSTDMIYMMEKFLTLQNDFFSAHPNKRDYLFVTEKGEPLYANYVYRITKKYLSLCSTVEKKSPHVLRHSFATHLSNRGAKLNDIKELLGHSSLASTQVYTHNTIEQLKEIYNLSHPKA